MADHDVIIVGSGLAGLTAGLFAARYGLSTLVLEANIPGGHLISIEKIEDFPGFPDGIPGYELCPHLQRPGRRRRGRRRLSPARGSHANELHRADHSFSSCSGILGSTCLPERNLG